MKLRKWQADALEGYFAKDQSNFLAVVTPGAGKTLFGLIAARKRLEQGCSRIVVACPTVGIKNQWVDVASRLQVPLVHSWDLDQESLGCVTTYDEIACNIEFFKKLSKNALVILDEVHHLGDKKSWGVNTSHAVENSAYRLCLTGTAIRTDKTKIPFVNYDGTGNLVPDFLYGYADAINDGVNRHIKFKTFKGLVEWETAGANFAVDLNDSLATNHLRKSLAMGLNESGGLVQEMLYSAASELPTGAAGLVIAQNQSHAKALCKVLESFGESPVLAVSSENGNRAIEQFKLSNQRWIVSVRQVSEGIDIPRIRSVVYCTNWCTELFFRQAIARAVREGPGVAYCYIPEHPLLTRLSREVEQEKLHFAPDQDDKESSQGCVSGERLGSTFIASTGEFSGVIDPFCTIAPSVCEEIQYRIRESKKSKLEWSRKYYATNPEHRDRVLRSSKERKARIGKKGYQKTDDSILNHALSLRVSGKTFRQIAELFNSEGKKPLRSQIWSASLLSSLLHKNFGSDVVSREVVGFPPFQGLTASDRANELRLQEHSFGKIADILNAEGFPTKTGGRWRASTVHVLIRRRGSQ